MIKPLGITIVVCLILALIVYIVMPKAESVEIKKTDGISEIVKNGDIICRLANTLWSYVFRDISKTDKRFSHVGVVRIIDGNITIIHSEGNTGHGRDFVNEMELEDFVKIAKTIGIFRINNIDGNSISNSAVKYLGVPFDWQFNMQDNSKLYCTELLYAILKDVKPELKLNTLFYSEKEIIPVDSISNSKDFSEIFFTEW